jgi:hypothetical protein
MAPHEVRRVVATPTVSATPRICECSTSGRPGGISLHSERRACVLASGTRDVDRSLRVHRTARTSEDFENAANRLRDRGLLARSKRLECRYAMPEGNVLLAQSAFVREAPRSTSRNLEAQEDQTATQNPKFSSFRSPR